MSNTLPTVSKPYSRVSGAVHENQTEFEPYVRLAAGSLGSNVESMLLPVTVPLDPDRAVLLAKLSLLGAAPRTWPTGATCVMLV